MRGLELSLLYLLVGFGVALAALARTRTGGGAGWGDAGLLLVFWPLYGPFVLMGRSGPTPAPGLPALAQGMPERLHRLSARVEQLEQVLAQPDFQLEAAQRRLELHQSQGELRAAARVEARIESIERLQRRRDALSENLAEARELMAQLRVQDQLMRVSGGSEADTSALVQELECRVQGLDALLVDP